MLLSHFRSLAVSFTLLFGVFSIAGATARAATFTVNSTADAGDNNPGDGACNTGRLNNDGSEQCTLRAAIQEANAESGAQQINVPAGTYALTQPASCTFQVVGNPHTFTVSTIALCATGQLSIQAAGANLTFIDAGGADRVLFVSTGANVTLQDITLRNGSQPHTGGSFGGGGCVDNQATLSLVRTAVSGCTGFTDGGGIYNAGALNVVNSTISGNTNLFNAGDGGGISNAGSATISSSTISLNTASFGGGGVSNISGSLVVTNSTISQNNSTFGGGIWVPAGTFVLTNSTVTGNTGNTTGGGLNLSFPATQATLNGDTIAQNNGAGLYVSIPSTIANTILSGNMIGAAESDCFTEPAFQVPHISLGHNVIQNAASCNLTGDTASNITGLDPRLGALANNGGPTKTMALSAGSPAIDAGSPSAPGSSASACAITDQRGLLRPQDTRCDIGAFERVRGLSISAILPAQGGAGGSVTAIVSGSGFQPGVTVTLQKSGQPSIGASPVAVDPGQASLAGLFDLTSAAPGAWDVVITNPDNSTTKLPGAFTVLATATQSPQLYADIVGQSAVRPGVPVKYALVYSNYGNNDVLGVPFTLSVQSNFTFGLLSRLSTPPANPSQVITDWTFFPRQVATPQPGFTNVVLFVPVIPAASSGVVEFEVLLPPTEQHGDTFGIAGGQADPYFNPTLDPNVVSNFVTSAQAYAQAAWNATIPDSLTSNMAAYLTSQFQTAVANGKNDLVASLGAFPDVYTASDFLIDLAAYGALQANPGLNSAFRPLAFINPDPPCTGQILQPGTSCDVGPEKIPQGDRPPKGKFPDSITPADCKAISNHQVTPDGLLCVPTNTHGCTSGFGPGNPLLGTDPLCHTYKIDNSVDPNDIGGPTGVGAARFIPKQAMKYAITFENLPAATAPAQVVTVTDQVDVSNLDLTTFAFGPISFGDQLAIPAPGQTSYQTGVDLRPGQNVIVNIQASLNPVTGLATWTFTSVDPDTEQLTTDPAAGFLPPDTNPPAGIGQVTFFVSPKSSIMTGTQVCDSANVVFDVNAPLNTGNFCNTFDITPPVSQVSGLPETEPTSSFTVSWSGTDQGSGIRFFTIYVSDSGGPFVPWQTQTTATSATFSGIAGHTYAFFSDATDAVGNIEALKTVADTSTTIQSNTSCATDITASLAISRGGFRYNHAAHAFVQNISFTNSGNAPLSLPLSLVLDQLPSAVTLLNSSGTTSCALPAGSPYINVGGVGSLAQGQAISATLTFGDPSQTAISYQMRVLTAAEPH